MEYAKNELGMERAAHAETSAAPEAELVIAPLECSLVGITQEIRIEAGSRSSRAYGKASAVETLRCRYGLNALYRERIEASPLRIVGTSEDHEVRLVELAEHPFYLASLFLPQMASRAGSPHPLVLAFVSAACNFGKERADGKRALGGGN